MEGTDGADSTDGRCCRCTGQTAECQIVDKVDSIDGRCWSGNRVDSRLLDCGSTDKRCGWGGQLCGKCMEWTIMVEGADSSDIEGSYVGTGWIALMEALMQGARGRQHRWKTGVWTGWIVGWIVDREDSRVNSTMEGARVAMGWTALMEGAEGTGKTDRSNGRGLGGAGVEWGRQHLTEHMGRCWSEEGASGQH